MINYSIKIRKVLELDDLTRSSIVNLYLEYYNESSEHRVLKDLAHKQEVLLLYHDDVIVGFTTMEYYTHQFSGQSSRLYSQVIR